RCRAVIGQCVLGALHCRAVIGQRVLGALRCRAVIGQRVLEALRCRAVIGGPYGAVGVDLAFEKMLGQIFGRDYIEHFKVKRPAAWVDLMISFEARKRTASPKRLNPLNISLPFSFIDYYRKYKGQSVETALKKSR
ncbi:hypothetical protein chiPu_0022382, partial [Chiloscyllium punctatum]|nr:hypothetical protein [Chiloscyllium punctatum]